MTAKDFLITLIKVVLYAVLFLCTVGFLLGYFWGFSLEVERGLVLFPSAMRALAIGVAGLIIIVFLIVVLICPLRSPKDNNR